jgi:hypothetical protein
MRQAPATADLYLSKAIDSIDGRLGKGYSKQHPELLAAFLHTCALDFGTAVLAQAIEGLYEPLRADDFGGLESSLNDIAKAIREHGEEAS